MTWERILDREERLFVDLCRTVVCDVFVSISCIEVQGFQI